PRLETVRSSGENQDGRLLAAVAGGQRMKVWRRVYVGLLVATALSATVGLVLVLCPRPPSGLPEKRHLSDSYDEIRLGMTWVEVSDILGPSHGTSEGVVDWFDGRYYLSIDFSFGDRVTSKWLWEMGPCVSAKGESCIAPITIRQEP